MSKLSMLIMKIREYQLRYETDTFNPELHGLFNESVLFLEFVGQQLDEIKASLREGV